MLFALLLLLLPNPAPAASRLLPKPSATTVPGFERVFCTAAGEWSVCQGHSGRGSEIFTRRGGEVRRRWPGEGFLGETSAFFVLQADLDGDGSGEWLIANHEFTSNGMAVERWRVDILASLEANTVLTQVYTADLGPQGLLRARGKAYDLLITSWTAGPDPTGRRGPGMYLVGRWMRYAQGRLTPADAPVLARRLLTNFQDQSARRPLSWLQHPRTEQRKTDPVVGDEASSITAAVVKVERVEEAGETEARVTLRTEDSKASVWDLTTFSDRENQFVAFGQKATGRLYPSRYLPPGVEGKRVRMVRYTSGDAAMRTAIAWLE